MDLIESRALQAKCIINLMTLVAKNRLSMLERMDLPQKAYEIGCLVGMLEGEIFQSRVNKYSVIDDLPFEGEIYEQFVNGVTVVIRQLLIDKNKDELAADQVRLRKIREEIQTGIDHTQNLLANVTQLEEALASSQLFNDNEKVLADFRERVEVMRSMGHLKDQERLVLDKLIEQNTILRDRTDQSLARLPHKAMLLKQLASRELLGIENQNKLFDGCAGAEDLTISGADALH